MKIVTYNAHYGIGKDERYDLARIVESVQGADIIALQEIERHYGPPDGPSQPEDLATLLAGYYWVFDAAFDIDGSERREDGVIVNRRRQHGQMLFSRWPILSKRYYPLPRLNIDSAFNMQMGVLEAVLATPVGALRIYNAHFGSVSSVERAQQAEFLVELVGNAPATGGAWTGSASHHPERDWSAGMEQPPMPGNAVVLGDFNMDPDSPEYEIMTRPVTATGTPLMTDIWSAKNPAGSPITWYQNLGLPGNTSEARLDYCFLTPELVPLIASVWIDQAAQGSDHQPLWLELVSD